MKDQPNTKYRKDGCRKRVGVRGLDESSVTATAFSVRSEPLRPLPIKDMPISLHLEASPCLASPRLVIER